MFSLINFVIFLQISCEMIVVIKCQQHHFSWQADKLLWSVQPPSEPACLLGTDNYRNKYSTTKGLIQWTPPSPPITTFRPMDDRYLGQLLCSVRTCVCLVIMPLVKTQLISMLALRPHDTIPKDSDFAEIQGVFPWAAEGQLLSSLLTQAAPRHFQDSTFFSVKVVVSTLDLCWTFKNTIFYRSSVCKSLQEPSSLFFLVGD